MGEGPNISGGVKYQAPIQEANTVDEAKPKEVKEEAPSAPPLKEAPRSADTSRRKLEQSYDGISVRYDLNKQLDYKYLNSESLKAADKIIMNPRLSNEAKIAELQKTIGKLDKADFQKFMNGYSTFPDDQRQLINSAITESEKIMGRIGSELPQDEQLKVVQEAVMHPLKGKNPKEEEKRLKRSDKGVAEWMVKTDHDTLDKALDGRSIDIRASAKLYGTMAAEAPRLIFGMHHSGKIDGDKLAIATEVMNAANNQQGPPVSRQDQEGLAASLIMKNIEHEERMRALRNRGNKMSS